MIAGVPERNGDAGGIVVRDGSHTPRTVTLAHVPGAGAPAPGDRFGAALASGMAELRPALQRHSWPARRAGTARARRTCCAARPARARARP